VPVGGNGTRGFACACGNDGRGLVCRRPGSGPQTRDPRVPPRASLSRPTGVTVNRGMTEALGVRRCDLALRRDHIGGGYNGAGENLVVTA